ncbi:MAG TPA: HEAT repeat domain-containing protein [Sedimentisphaerales bacterium]|jgi:HEAT repeat protein|nr:HEAT repeat domain-containing protein [Sedimentisphaerales bacterium]
MTRSLLKISVTAMATVALFAVASPALAQSGEDLVKQLSGKAEAPARDATQLAQAYQTAIEYLVPLMSAPDVGSRYRYQIMLQDMGSHAARPGAQAERETLAKALVKTVEQSAIENTVRHWIVLQLERIGKGESVPCLAKLMTDPDEHLRDYARRALEKNPDASATNALLEALSEARDVKWRIGLVSSLGSRGDRTAVQSLSRALSDPDRKVAAAVVTALARIGGQDSVRALLGVVETPLSPIHMKAAQGLIDVAQEMARHNDLAGAATIYGTLYDCATQAAEKSVDVNPFSIRAAAITGLMTCNPEKSAARIPELMRDRDPKVRAAVVQAARNVESKAPMHALVVLLPDLDPRSQVQVLGLICDRGDLSTVKPAIRVLNSSEDSVRLAAIETLTKIGTDEGAEALLQIAVADGGTPALGGDRFPAGGGWATQKAAREGLALMAGPRVDETISAFAASGEANTRAVAIGLLGKRRVSGSAQSLLSYAADVDEQISRAAFGALVDLADTVDVTALTDLVAKTKSPAVRESAVAALRAALAVAKDKDATADAVLSRMKTADAETRIAMLSCLDALGGTAALAAVCDAAQSADDALREAGIRTLGNWPEFEATETLAVIASKSETSLTHCVLAVRGALRLIGASQSAPLEDRITLCLAVLDCARRDDERRQAIATLGTLPGPKAIDRLQELLQSETLKAEAGMALVDLAGRLTMTDREAARSLAQKIRDLNISDEINRRADGVISGRGWRRR